MFDNELFDNELFITSLEGFNAIFGIAVDEGDNLYVCDKACGCIHVYWVAFDLYPCDEFMTKINNYASFAFTVL